MEMYANYDREQEALANTHAEDDKVDPALVRVIPSNK